MALRLPKTISDDDRHAAWRRVVERIYDEQVSQGWRHQTFRLFRAVFSTNPKLSNEGGFLYDYIAETYVDSALMLVRRELDVQAGTENLRNLLEDISENSQILTRRRYLKQWGGTPEERHIAHRAFDKFNPMKVQGDRDADHVDPAVVRADLDTAIKAGERVRLFAERTRAHRTPAGGLKTVTFTEMHQAIADIRKVVKTYYALLTLSVVTRWEPVAQYDTIEPFMTAWASDPAAVADAAQKDSGDANP